jgi:NTE family protein
VQDQNVREAHGAGTGVRRINLALQGGGSHGAFTWGVLDRLLQEPLIEIEGISGTSAGAVNAMVLASGLVKGGNDGERAKEQARVALKEFWMCVGEQHSRTPFRRNPMDVVFGRFRFDLSWSYHFFASLTHLVSPYHWNPLNVNPLKDLVRSHIDFESIRNHSKIKLFISATSVESGRIRVFKNAELNESALLASTALPLLFHAAEVDGQHYWDGGFVGNPALFPIFYECESPDILLVQISPQRRSSIPKSVFEIQDRMSEIAFNASLTAEMRAVHFVNRMIEKGTFRDDASASRYRQVLIHMIEGEQEFSELNSSTKILIEPAFLLHLFDHGKRAAETWLEKNLQHIGQRSTVDVRARFLT